MEIVRIPIEDLTPDPHNAKDHPKEQIEQIKASIEQFGNADPIGVWGEKNLVVEGHGRLLALKELGYTEVECIRLDWMTEEERKAYALVHNQTTLTSGWIPEELNLNLSAITEIDMSQFGFDVPDDTTPEEIQDDEIPEEVEERSKLGDIWQLGRHRLICGDSTNLETIGRLMGDERADFVFTDPPWNVNYGDVEKGNSQGYRPRKILNDYMDTEDFKNFMSSAFNTMNHYSKDGAMTYVVMSAQEWGNLMLTLLENGYHWSSTIIWFKDSLVLSRKDYHTQYEPIWYGWKEGSRLHPLKDRKQSDVLEIPRPKVSDLHPTMKPIALIARAIANSTKKDDKVLDLFGGSGSTLIACEQTNRVCYMSELDPHYCDVIVERWENLTGGKAVLLNDEG